MQTTAELHNKLRHAEMNFALKPRSSILPEAFRPTKVCCNLRTPPATASSSDRAVRKGLVRAAKRRASKAVASGSEVQGLSLTERKRLRALQAGSEGTNACDGITNGDAGGTGVDAVRLEGWGSYTAKQPQASVAGRRHEGSCVGEQAGPVGCEGHESNSSGGFPSEAEAAPRARAGELKSSGRCLPKAQGMMIVAASPSHRAMSALAQGLVVDLQGTENGGPVGGQLPRVAHHPLQLQHRQDVVNRDEEEAGDVEGAVHKLPDLCGRENPAALCGAATYCAKSAACEREAAVQHCNSSERGEKNSSTTPETGQSRGLTLAARIFACRAIGDSAGNGSCSLAPVQGSTPSAARVSVAPTPANSVPMHNESTTHAECEKTLPKGFAPVACPADAAKLTAEVPLAQRVLLASASDGSAVAGKGPSKAPNRLMASPDGVASTCRVPPRGMTGVVALDAAARKDQKLPAKEPPARKRPRSSTVKRPKLLPLYPELADDALDDVPLLWRGLIQRTCLRYGPHPKRPRVKPAHKSPLISPCDVPSNSPLPPTRAAAVLDFQQMDAIARIPEWASAQVTMGDVAKAARSTDPLSALVEACLPAQVLREALRASTAPETSTSNPMWQPNSCAANAATPHLHTPVSEQCNSKAVIECIPESGVKNISIVDGKPGSEDPLDGAGSVLKAVWDPSGTDRTLRNEAIPETAHPPPAAAAENRGMACASSSGFAAMQDTRRLSELPSNAEVVPSHAAGCCEALLCTSGPSLGTPRPEPHHDDSEPRPCNNDPGPRPGGYGSEPQPCGNDSGFRQGGSDVLHDSLEVVSFGKSAELDAPSLRGSDPLGDPLSNRPGVDDRSRPCMSARQQNVAPHDIPPTRSTPLTTKATTPGLHIGASPPTTSADRQLSQWQAASHASTLDPVGSARAEQQVDPAPHLRQATATAPTAAGVLQNARPAAALQPARAQRPLVYGSRGGRGRGRRVAAGDDDDAPLVSVCVDRHRSAGVSRAAGRNLPEHWLRASVGSICEERSSTHPGVRACGSDEAMSNPRAVGSSPARQQQDCDINSRPLSAPHLKPPPFSLDSPVSHGNPACHEQSSMHQGIRECGTDKAAVLSNPGAVGNPLAQGQQASETNASPSSPPHPKAPPIPNACSPAALHCSSEKRAAPPQSAVDPSSSNVRGPSACQPQQAFSSVPPSAAPLHSTHIGNQHVHRTSTMTSDIVSPGFWQVHKRPTLAFDPGDQQAHETSIVPVSPGNLQAHVPSTVQVKPSDQQAHETSTVPISPCNQQAHVSSTVQVNPGNLQEHETSKAPVHHRQSSRPSVPMQMVRGPSGKTARMISPSNQLVCDVGKDVLDSPRTPAVIATVILDTMAIPESELGNYAIAADCTSPPRALASLASSIGCVPDTPDGSQDLARPDTGSQHAALPTNASSSPGIPRQIGQPASARPGTVSISQTRKCLAEFMQHQKRGPALPVCRGVPGAEALTHSMSHAAGLSPAVEMNPSAAVAGAPTGRTSNTGPVTPVVTNDVRIAGTGHCTTSRPHVPVVEMGSRPPPAMFVDTCVDMHGAGTGLSAQGRLQLPIERSALGGSTQAPAAGLLATEAAVPRCGANGADDERLSMAHVHGASVGILPAPQQGRRSGAAEIPHCSDACVSGADPSCKATLSEGRPQSIHGRNACATADNSVEHESRGTAPAQTHKMRSGNSTCASAPRATDKSAAEDVWRKVQREGTLNVSGGCRKVQQGGTLEASIGSAPVGHPMPTQLKLQVRSQHTPSGRVTSLAFPRQSAPAGGACALATLTPSPTEVQASGRQPVGVIEPGALPDRCTNQATPAAPTSLGPKKCNASDVSQSQTLKCAGELCMHCAADDDDDHALHAVFDSQAADACTSSLPPIGSITPLKCSAFPSQRVHLQQQMAVRANGHPSKSSAAPEAIKVECQTASKSHRESLSSATVACGDPAIVDLSNSQSQELRGRVGQEKRARGRASPRVLGHSDSLHATGAAAENCADATPPASRKTSVLVLGGDSDSDDGGLRALKGANLRPAGAGGLSHTGVSPPEEASQEVGLAQRRPASAAMGGCSIHRRLAQKVLGSDSEGGSAEGAFAGFLLCSETPHRSC
jgi:hypothetical protein